MLRRLIVMSATLMAIGVGSAFAQSPDFRPVISAIEDNNLATLKLAVMGGASTNQRDEEGRPALVFAAAQNRWQIMDYLIEAGANLNGTSRATRETAVMAAASAGHVEALEVLVEAGADLDKEDKQGETALMKAVHNGHLMATRILVEGGADLNQTDYTGRTALFHAEEARETGIFNYLSQQGATR